MLMGMYLHVLLVLVAQFPYVESIAQPIAGVARPNYGVDFNFLFSLNNMHGTWKHAWTFDISMLDRTSFQKGRLQCFNDISPLCEAQHDFLNMTYALFTELVQQSGNKHKWLNDPEILATMERVGDRKKRALLPFIGDIEHFFFGVATDTELNSFKATIKDVTDLSGKTVREVTNLGNQLASLSKITESINANSKKGMTELHSMLGNLTAQVNDRMKTIELFYKLSSNRSDNMEREMVRSWMIHEQIQRVTASIMEVQQADMRILSGIQTVLQGYIPIEWVSPQDLRSGLQVAEEGIRNLFPEARLTHSQRALGYYYTHKLVTPVISAKRITLVVDIPVDLGQQVLYVYAVRRFPVSLLPFNPYLGTVDGRGSISRAISILDERHDYFLVSQDGSMYSTAENRDIQLCQGEVIKECPKQFPLYSMDYQSCLQALWKDENFDTILELCPYKLQHVKHAQQNHLFVQVIPLSNGRWYIDAPLDEKWTVVCPDRSPEVRQACTSCVVQVDCGCGIKSKWFQIPTRLSACSNVFSPMSHNYTINPFQYQSSDVPWIINLTGSQEFSSPPMDIPKILIPSGDNWDDVMESMDAKQYDLNRLYTKQVNETKMFRTSAEALLEKIKSQDAVLTEISSWPSWIVTTALMLSFANSACIILMCYCLLSRGAHAASLAASFQKEHPFLQEGSTVTLISLDVVILIMVSIILMLQLLLAWPIISQWLMSNRWYKKFVGAPGLVKACSFRYFSGQTVASIQGIATFIWKTHRRQVPVSIGISGVPRGTHRVDHSPIPDTAQVEKQDEVYQIDLSIGYKLVTLGDREIYIKQFYVPVEDMHTEYDVPIKYDLMDITQITFSLLPNHV